MGSKRDEVMEGAKAFVEASNPQDHEFVVNFSDTVTFGLPRVTYLPASWKIYKLRFWLPLRAEKQPCMMPSRLPWNVFKGITVKGKFWS